MKKTSLVSLHVFKLKKPEFVSFITDFIAVFEQSGLPADFDGVFDLLFKRLKAQLSEYRSLVGPLTAEDLVGLQLEASEQVSAAFEQLVLALKAYQLSQIREEREAYKALTVLLRPFEGQPQTMAQLVTQLESVEMKQYVGVLSLAKPVYELKVLVENLVKLTANEEARPRRSPSSTKAVREGLTTTYYQLADYIALMWDITELDTYEFTLGILNDVRQFYAHQLAERGEKNKKN